MGFGSIGKGGGATQPSGPVSISYNPETGGYGYWTGGYDGEGGGSAPVWNPVANSPAEIAGQIRQEFRDSLTPQQEYSLANSVQADPNDPRGTMAEMIRANFNDYAARIQPLETLLQKYTTYNGNPGVVGELNAASDRKVQGNFDLAKGITARQQQRLGMAPDAVAAQEQSRDLGLAQTAATVDEHNRNQQFQQDLNRQIVAGTGMAAKQKFVGA